MNQENVQRLIATTRALELAHSLFGRNPPNTDQQDVLLSGLRACEQLVSVLPPGDLPLIPAAEILRVLEFDESDPVFHSIQAHLAFKQGDYDQAVESAQHAVGLDPTNINRVLKLANIYQQIYHSPRDGVDLHTGYNQAIALGKAIELEPNNSSLRASQYDLMRYMEMHSACFYAARQWVRLMPDDHQALFALAQSQMTFGYREEALANLAKARELSDDNALYVYFQFESYSDSGNPQDLANIERKLSSTGGGPEQTDLLFAKAYLLEAEGRYPEAFEAMKQANHTLESFAFTEPYDPHMGAPFIQAIQTAYPAGSGGPQPVMRTMREYVQPIFVMGLPRTGTTLVQQILASHKNPGGGADVFPGGELVQLGKARDVLAYRQTHPHSDSEQQRLVPASIALHYLESAANILGLSQHPDAKYFVDKLPDNIHQIELALQLFPDSPIVVCERNYLDVGISAFRRNFRNQEDMRMFNDIENYGAYIREYYQPMIDVWKRALPEGRVHFVRYEDLVRHPEKQIPALLEYCGLSWSPNCLTPHRSQIPNVTEARVRSPISASSIGSWRRYEEQLAPLIKILGDGEPNQ